MAFGFLFFAPVALAFIAGLVCLILSVFIKAKRKWLLKIGCALCVPLMAVILITVIMNLFMSS